MSTNNFDVVTETPETLAEHINDIVDENCVSALQLSIVLNMVCVKVSVSKILKAIIWTVTIYDNE